MGNVLDIFNDDAFSAVEMTEAINLLPFQPARLGNIGLFTGKGIRTTAAAIERKGNVLSLLPSTQRGTRGVKATAEKRDLRSLMCPHIPQYDTILADDIQDVRQFGKDAGVMQSVQSEVTDRQENMRQNHETTEEYLRVGAIHGIITDGDGSTVLYNLFDEFGITEPTEVVWDLANATPVEVKTLCTDIRRHMENELGGTVVPRIRGFCGDDFWDALVVHDMVKEAYDRFQESAFFRTDQRIPEGTGGFEYCGILFENYRGSVSGGDPFIATDKCRFVVDGVPNLFKTYYAPADYIEAANTIGRQIYNKQQRMDFDKGIELETQSNPLPICTRPNTLIAAGLA